MNTATNKGCKAINIQQINQIAMGKVANIHLTQVMGIRTQLVGLSKRSFPETDHHRSQLGCNDLRVSIMKHGPDYCSFRCPTKMWGVCACANNRYQALFPLAGVKLHILCSVVRLPCASEHSQHFVISDIYSSAICMILMPLRNANTTI